jgi:hypothetical protein
VSELAGRRWEMGVWEEEVKGGKRGRREPYLLHRPPTTTHIPSCAPVSVHVKVREPGGALTPPGS